MKTLYENGNKNKEQEKPLESRWKNGNLNQFVLGSFV